MPTILPSYAKELIPTFDTNDSDGLFAVLFNEFEKGITDGDGTMSGVYISRDENFGEIGDWNATLLEEHLYLEIHKAVESSQYSLDELKRLLNWKVKNGPRSNYHPNGKVSEEIIKIGKDMFSMNGWYESGARQFMAKFSSDLNFVLFRHWKANGVYEYTCNLRNDFEDGFITYYDMGLTHSVFFRGLGHEVINFLEVKSKYQNGNPFFNLRIEKGKFVDGIKAWHQNGRVAWHYRLRNGIFNGQLKAWHPNGQPALIVEIKESFPDGEFLLWHENGQVLAEGFLEDGRFKGVWKVYYSSSQEALVWEFVEGYAQGPFELFYPNGKSAISASFKNGELDGPWVLLDEVGCVLNWGAYRNGLKLQK